MHIMGKILGVKIIEIGKLFRETCINLSVQKLLFDSKLSYFRSWLYTIYGLEYISTVKYEQ